MAFTPDGTNLVLWERKGSDSDLSLLTLNGPREARPLTGLNTPAYEAGADLSPDGRWLAYQSNESGHFQIYVRPFPDVARARYTISPRGGVNPAWSRTMAANSSTSRRNEPGCSRRFPSSQAWSFDSARACPSSMSADMSRRGTHAVTMSPATASASCSSGSRRCRPLRDLTVVINWFEELKARMRQN